jgi:hypothetical protein
MSQSKNESHLYTEVVISGISGHFLDSADIQQGARVNTWPIQSAKQPLAQLDFPAIDCTQLNKLDETSKSLAACVYDAVFDSGLNPANLATTKTGLFLATCHFDSKKLPSEDQLTTCKHNQYTNQIASVFKLNGN